MAPTRNASNMQLPSAPHSRTSPSSAFTRAIVRSPLVSSIIWHTRACFARVAQVSYHNTQSHKHIQKPTPCTPSLPLIRSHAHSVAHFVSHPHMRAFTRTKCINEHFIEAHRSIRTLARSFARSPSAIGHNRLAYIPMCAHFATPVHSHSLLHALSFAHVHSHRFAQAHSSEFLDPHSASMHRRSLTAKNVRDCVRAG